uniref:Nucleoside diphosphate kinase n=2 Tax=Steinernema glaseri TaxID=37863 RepID=A0A1I8AK12_9BILA
MLALRIQCCWLLDVVPRSPKWGTWRAHLSMASSRTFGLIKPDAVGNPFVLRRIVDSLSTSKELEVVAAKRLHISRDQAARLYEAHKGKFFFDRLVRHVTSGPSIALLMQSRRAGVDAVAAWRGMLGPSKLFRSAFTERTLRTQFALSDTRNVGHGSDGLEDTLRELAIFEPLQPFDCSELFKQELLSAVCKGVILERASLRGRSLLLLPPECRGDTVNERRSQEVLRIIYGSPKAYRSQPKSERRRRSGGAFLSKKVKMANLSKGQQT